MQIRENTFTQELGYISVSLADGCLPMARHWMDQLLTQLDSDSVVTEARFKVAAREALVRYDKQYAELEAARKKIKEQQRR